MAAQATGTPLQVLLAITRVETGRGTGQDLRPWPWTINQAGDGRWFETADLATAAAKNALDTSAGNLDIGCFQVNHRWHGANFASLEDMFDPLSNARYAAAFLSKLHRETGDWPAAIAAYHSRQPGPAARYLAKFQTTLAALGPMEASRSARKNSYPLLQSRGRGSRGSLVPLFAASGPLFGATP